MRDPNRIRERFTLSLDGRQVASVVVGSLVVLAAVFVLGFSVGRQIGLREARPAAAPADPLAALDAPSPRPDAGEPPPRLSYHEALTKDRPAELPRPAPARAPAAEPRPAPAAPSPPSQRAEASPAPRELPAAPAAGAPAGAFAVQVGASQDRAEADRIAEKYRSHRPRVVEAVVPGKGRWYRVRLGAFETRSEADRYLLDLSRETGAKGFVTGGD
ncbi:MAG TPA: SPOR domain-containing protein [Anaeromyxobacteraceae bacterium]|nr:SPOR domain-containing protein [Anaeromyxobacteraceae bacterium]